MLRRLIKRVRVGYYWVNALDSVSKDDFKEARKLLLQIKEIDPPGLSEYLLLLGFTHLRLASYPAALHCIKAFQERVYQTGAYNQQDENYLLCYANCILDKIEKKLPGERVDYLGEPAQIDLAQVAPHMQRNFPLPGFESFESWIKKRREENQGIHDS